jgi:hypothetical protein
MPVVCHFLIVFDHAARNLISVENFVSPAQALKAYADAEAKHRHEDRLEIVLVGADSIDTIHTTHGQYFVTDERPSSRYLSAV